MDKLMDKEIICSIAPFLRGLSFDGAAGKIVHFADQSEESATAQAEIRPTSLEIDEFRDDAGWYDDTRKRFDAYRSEFGIPSKVSVGSKLAFGFGSDYDEAKKNATGDSRDGALKAEVATRAAEAPAPHATAKAVAGPARRRDPNRDLHAARNGVVDGKVSVVTGGAQGFGEEIVRHLIAAGSTVFIADINESGAAGLADELNRSMGSTKAFPIRVDVTSEESIAGLVASVTAEVGGIDVFISNAGVLKAGSVKELDLDAFEFVTRVNYAGYFLCVKHASRVMALQHEANSGCFTDIIQINSKSGLEGSNKNGAYAGGKFGGIGLTQSFALELVTDGIKVNSVCPGNFYEGPLWSDPEKGLFVQYLKTGKVPGATSVQEVRAFYEDKVPMKRGCTGADVMKAIYYIIDQTYETGQAVPVTGGQVMLR